MAKKTRNTGNLQTVLVSFAINKLLLATYGYRHRSAVLSESRSYMETYKANSIGGRTELREDLAKLLTKKSSNWVAHDPRRAMQMVTAARSLDLT